MDNDAIITVDEYRNREIYYCSRDDRSKTIAIFQRIASTKSRKSTIPIRTQIRCMVWLCFNHFDLRQKIIFSVRLNLVTTRTWSNAHECYKYECAVRVKRNTIVKRSPPSNINYTLMPGCTKYG